MINNDFFLKIFWSFAPLLWGVLSWSVWHIQTLSDPFKILILSFVAFIVTNVFFGKALNHAMRYHLRFLNIEFQLPRWQFFFIPIFVGSIILFIWPLLFDNEIIRSFLQGIFLYSICEEFITRSFLIKYKMRESEFLGLNVLSSLSFSFMHWFYGETFIQTLTVGHFPFTFALSIIAYKTQRIELTIILHVISNFINYTLLHLMLGDDFSHSIYVIAILVFNTLFYMTLAGYISSVQSKPA